MLSGAAAVIFLPGAVNLMITQNSDQFSFSAALIQCLLQPLVGLLFATIYLVREDFREDHPANTIEVIGEAEFHDDSEQQSEPKSEIPEEHDDSLWSADLADGQSLNEER